MGEDELAEVGIGADELSEEDATAGVVLKAVAR